MDKFKVKLNKSGETIISRVLNFLLLFENPFKKYLTTLQEMILIIIICGCSWPYHLLLPHGTREGMKFKLFVFISDWNVDKVPDGTEEGSLYPDARDI
ncbi:Di-copper centre-containing protein [Gigaspora margarita]|uniref:Di-copper centre-containing protein n=1 Tax=Gigaspora margarita TaxID=4874 RepID=A0A8H4AJI8_GIGMA|nr:Di-copper centre-containing protein [Gigaspora margarita]